jgi:DNA helicase HerA-like ATPase
VIPSIEAAMTSADQFIADRRDGGTTSGLPGRVLSVHGSQAAVGWPPTNLDGADDACVTVGKFLRIQRGRSRLIGMITDVSVEVPAVAREQGYAATARLDIMGEIREDDAGTPRFQRGVTDYPAIGDGAALIDGSELRLIYDISSSDTIEIGHLQHDSSISAYINIDEMLSKHFAILGTTGVGKSSGVALIVQRILETRPNLRIFLLDGHNEYGRCFGDRAQVLNPRNLKLPFWLFNFEETVDVIFGGRPGAEEEVVILSEVIPIAKSMYTQHKPSAERLVIKRVDPKATGYTVDTPVPYRLADLVAAIDERMGKLENRSSRMSYYKLISRIETVRNDPRYAFMFENANVGGDTMADVLRQLFRLVPDGKPMTIMQLAGFPAEVVDSVVSVLCRMAFDFGLWSDGAVPLLFVCEEAHRYASADRSIGFGPTRKALSRIAKEGRKYGVFLGLVTQRPAELDATIISQCSTLFAMRMANDRDHALIRSAVSDAAANLLAFVPSLGTREVLAFGEGVALPTRLKFSKLPAEQLPRSEAVTSGRLDPTRVGEVDFIESVVDRWRGSTMSNKHRFDDDGPDLDFIAKEDAAAAPSGLGLDPNRFRLLKQRNEEADTLAAAQKSPPGQSVRWPTR